MLAFGDKNGDKAYGGDTKDVSIRSVVLNDDIKDKRINYTFNHVAFGQPQPSVDRVVWTFNQNGTFGYTNDQNLLYSDGYIQIVLTDARAVSDADKKFRSAVVLIDSSGRVEVCPRGDQRTMCQYK